MLDGKVFDICASYGYIRCNLCPLFNVCGTPNDELPGDTMKEKMASWESQMNEAAKEVHE